MYLHLTSSNGEGYISAMTENHSSIFCKPVSKRELEAILKNITSSGNYVVEESESGKTFIAKERVSSEQMMQQQTESYIKADKETNSQKQQTEFARYKQDARKRALDIAATRKIMVDNIIYDNATSDVVMKEADKYYNWLISIPQ